MTPARPSDATRDPAPVRWLLIGAAVAFLAAVLLLPMALIFKEALAHGARVYLAALAEPEARSALQLTLLTAAIVVPVNTLFGLAAAWALTRFHYRGKSVLLTLIDLPMAVSPVIAGMIFVLMFGARGWFGPTLAGLDLQVIFATPGIVIATTFITLPFVARELVAFMQAQGSDQEEAALTLGASSWQMFFRVTLPGIKWGLFYGVILCNARAMGEFGAVSVVSGHIRGETNTLPLHVEILYNEYRFSAAFAVASLLVLLALATLALKRLVEWRAHREAGAGGRGAV